MPELRCAVQSAALGESPVGSAGHDDHYLLVELPLPWPAKIEEHPLLADLRNQLGKGAETRILALRAADGEVVGPDGSPMHRVITYRGGDGSSFERFDRHEAAIERRRLTEVLDQILDGDPSVLGTVRPGDDQINDVLICTHGTRDRCCGTDGARLFMELVERGLPGVRLWRTSHTGGHRFAPVALSFPDGITWGRIDVDTLASALTRSIEPERLTGQNRGSVGFADPRAQGADGAVLARVGWSWLAGPRAAQVDEVDAPTSIVTIEGPGGRFEVTLRAGEPIPVPPCGEPLSLSRKTTTPLQIDGVRSLD